MILLVGFGYAKPVPVNMLNFKKRKRDMAITAFAGPVTNLIMALFFLILFNLMRFVINTGSQEIVSIATFIFLVAIRNIYLAVFNLLPIPPLDGSRIASAVLPDGIYYRIMRHERYIMIGLFVLMFTGVLSIPIRFLSNLIYTGLSFLADLPFKPFM
ncbi:MAG: site-2 protease family protein [Oscillospiraceae bacterium]|nr:site-2 protease family protein [Oscillospiraceae bacterium]